MSYKEKYDIINPVINLKILFVIAMEKEAKELIKNYKLEKVNDKFYQKDELSLIITGISRNNVTLSLLELSKYYDLENSILINVGFVGSNNLNIGDVILVNKSYGYHFDLTPFGDPLYHNAYSPYQLNTIESFKLLDCYTSDGFVTKTSIKEDTIFDMELNSIILFPHKKIYSIKIVSDTLDENRYSNFNYDKGIADSIDSINRIINLLKKCNLN